MFGERRVRSRSTALLFFIVLLASGCGSTTLYRATPEDTRDLSPAQARKMLIKTAPSVSRCSTPTKYAVVTHETFRYSCEGPYRFSEYPALVAMQHLGGPMEAGSSDKNRTCVNFREVPGKWHRECMFFHPFQFGDNLPAARNFVRAWYVWARDGTAFNLAQEAAFEQAAQSYRNAAVKPQLPEEAVKHKVQAEAAVQQKRFYDSVELYDQALGMAPWWPQGHYNRGVILGELEAFEEAIPALQKYLKLEPDASNARAVQLKIYQWEALVPATAK